MARPRKPTEEKFIPRCIRNPARVWEIVDSRAEREHIPAAEALRRIVEEYDGVRKFKALLEQEYLSPKREQSPAAK